MMIPIEFFPPLNASLNGAASVFLFLGWRAIRKKNVTLHRTCMMSALAISAVFLASYLTYHFNATAMTPYQGPDVLRPVYYFILATHIPLAGVVVPACLIAVFRALKNDLVGHKKIVRWLWPVWMYVSVTGVLIYLMLYQL